MKKCIKCSKNKPTVEFHKHKEMKDGRLNKCRSCVVKDVYAWRAVNEGCRSKEYKKSKAKDPIQYKAKSAARTSKRRRTAKNAQPLWANQQYINDLYINAAEANAMFEAIGLSPKFEIDHIVPLQNEQVCGLHTEHNLQVLNRTANRRKANKFKVG
jgi:hypothetical protein